MSRARLIIMAMFHSATGTSNVPSPLEARIPRDQIQGTQLGVASGNNVDPTYVAHVLEVRWRQIRHEDVFVPENLNRDRPGRIEVLNNFQFHARHLKKRFVNWLVDGNRCQNSKRVGGHGLRPARGR